MPILPSADLDRSIAYYGYLGFSVVDRSADYVRMRRGAIEFHLYLDADHRALTNSAGCYLRVTAAHALRSEWTSDGIQCLDVPVPDSYGPTVFAVVDPDGNTIRVGPGESGCREDAEPSL